MGRRATCHLSKADIGCARAAQACQGSPHGCVLLRLCFGSRARDSEGVAGGSLEIALGHGWAAAHWVMGLITNHPLTSILLLCACLGQPWLQ